MRTQVLKMVVMALLAIGGTNAIADSLLGYGQTRCLIVNALQADDQTLREGIDSWALGFLSGRNQAAIDHGKPDKLRKMQPDRIAAYIRVYCARKTDETVAQAVNSYWQKSIDR